MRTDRTEPNFVCIATRRATPIQHRTERSSGRFWTGSAVLLLALSFAVGFIVATVMRSHA